MPGFDDKRSAKLRTGAPCGNEASNVRFCFFDVAESIWYSVCGGDVGAKNDMICDANYSRSLRVMTSFPLSKISVEFDNRLDGRLSFLNRGFKLGSLFLL